MAKNRIHHGRKRRTREHVIADLAVNHVERFVLRCGYTMHRVVHDYGLDLAVTTYANRGEVENGVVWMQVKATEDPQRLTQAPALRTRVQRKDLLSWNGELYPVILILYDAGADQAYWIHVQQVCKGGKLSELARRGATLTLPVPVGQVIDEEAIRKFRDLKAQCFAPW